MPTASLASALDQATKGWALAGLTEPPRVVSATSFFDLALGRSRGVGFGLPEAILAAEAAVAPPGIDTTWARPHLGPMRGLLRTVLAVLVLASAAGTVLHATRAAVMDLAMAAAPSADTPMPGCDGCGEDGDDNPGPATGSSCAALCAAPPMAPPTSVPQLVPSAPAVAEPVADMPAPVGLTGPPDLHPPRTIVLS